MWLAPGREFSFPLASFKFLLASLKLPDDH
jgi:hypothetical protein